MATTIDDQRCPIFGAPKKLDDYVLPKIEDVIRFYDYAKIRYRNGRNEVTNNDQVNIPSDVIELVAENVEAAWMISSIPIIAHAEIVQKIWRFINGRMVLLKVSNTDQMNATFLKEIDRFWENSQQLFDICSCTCTTEMICLEQKSRHVPKNKLDFLWDQRTDRKLIHNKIRYARKLMIQPRDDVKQQKFSKEVINILSTNCEIMPTVMKHGNKKKLKQLNNKLDCISPQGYQLRERSVKRQSKFLKQHHKWLASVDDGDNADNKKVAKDQSHSSYKSKKKKRNYESDGSGDLWVPPKGDSRLGSRDVTNRMVKIDQLRIPLPTLSRECERYNISDHKGSAIATAVLQDFNIVNENNLTCVINKSKLCRERQKYRASISVIGLKLTNIYFDGKRDKSLKDIVMDNKRYRREVIEEHITILSEPNHQYVGHVTPTDGDSKGIVEAMFKFFTCNSVSIDQLAVIGCDGTKVNVGSKGGVIRLLEERLNKPLHYFICLLHLNEIPLRRLFQYVDAVSEETGLYSGPIGKAIFNTPFHAILRPTEGIQFQAMECDLPDLKNIDILSHDQKYLYQMCKAISSGVCDVDLSRRYPGNISSARWLTTANRILRLYIATSTPTRTLYLMTCYIIKVYAPIWFDIKAKYRCVNGARHLFRLIQLSRFLAPDERRVVDDVIQRNAYFAHPENLLLAMLTDENQSIRQLAYENILTIRSRIQSDTIRTFIIPIINFNASDYTEMIHWQSIKATEPPLTIPLDISELQNIVETGDDSRFRDYPCHIQAVERTIRLVSTASMSVCSHARREGLIRSTLKSRSIIKDYSKSKYKCK